MISISKIINGSIKAKNDIYKTYQRNDDLPYKIKHYGILKSCEYSIAESLNNIILIIDDLIKEK
jgi:hypothetical protein